MKPNSNAITWHRSTREPLKCWTVEKLLGFGVKKTFHVRCYVNGVLISDNDFNRETRARDAFEKRVENHYA